MPISVELRHIVVSDAGPLIALGRINALDLLPRLFLRVDVTETVIAECLARPDLPDAAHIAHALEQGWLQRSPDLAGTTSAALDAGESSAIAYALAAGIGILMDDRVAVVHARAIGLKVIGTLGVLLMAKKHGYLAGIAPVIDRLAAGGHHLSKSAITAALALAGETPKDLS